MTADDWIPYATACALLEDGKYAWPQLSRQLILGRVNSRGAKADDPDGEPVKIEPSLWSEWLFKPWRGRLIPPSSRHRRVPVGFVKVRFSRADVLLLSPDVKEASTQATAPPTNPNVPNAVSTPAELGRRGGLARAKNDRHRVARWQLFAAGKAQEIRQKNRTLSQEDLADSILDKWQIGLRAVGRKRLIEFISKLEKDNNLPRRSGSTGK
jgi:hypothetical protein